MSVNDIVYLEKALFHYQRISHFEKSFGHQ